MKNIFEGLGNTAAKWSVTDFYDEHRAALEAALASGEDFTTGWFGVKKEIRSACVTVEAGQASVCVTCEMDEGRDLVDTAIWEAEDKKDGSGDAALIRLEPRLTEANRERVIEWISTNTEIDGENIASQNQRCEATWEAIKAALDQCEEDADEELENNYQDVIWYVKGHLTGIIKDVLENDLRPENGGFDADEDYLD